MNNKKLRCYICNRVNTRSIETNALETVKGHFHRDKRDDTKVLCEECQGVIQDQLSEYYYYTDG